jgi:hypothetical protein
LLRSQVSSATHVTMMCAYTMSNHFLPPMFVFSTSATEATHQTLPLGAIAELPTVFVPWAGDGSGASFSSLVCVTSKGSVETLQFQKWLEWVDTFYARDRTMPLLIKVELNPLPAVALKALRRAGRLLTTRYLCLMSPQLDCGPGRLVLGTLQLAKRLNIILMCSPPNCTSHMQEQDQSFAPFKMRLTQVADEVEMARAGTGAICFSAVFPHLTLL